MKSGNSREATGAGHAIEKGSEKWLGLECILETKLAELNGGFDVGSDRKEGAKDSCQIVFASTTGQMIPSTEIEDTKEGQIWKQGKKSRFPFGPVKFEMSVS